MGFFLNSMPNLYFSPLRFLLGLSFALILQYLFFGYVSGQFYKPKEYQSPPLFNSYFASKFSSEITKYPRIVGSSHFNRSYDLLFQLLAQLSSNSNMNKTLAFSFTSGNASFTSGRNINHIQNNIRSITITINSTNLKSTTPIILSSHLDSHATTTGSYDDGINVALMISLAAAIMKSNETIRQPIQFIFLGSEEMGLHGSLQYVSKNNDLKGHILNMESFGRGRPFGLIWKTKKSSSVVRSFSRIKGSLIATFFTDITKLNILNSRSDIDIYDQIGLTGGQTVFFGNPAVYHTLMDSDCSYSDLEYAGNQLLNFLFNFTADDEEKDLVAFGISPFVILIDKSIFPIIVYTVSVIALTVTFLFNPQFNPTSYLKPVFTWFVISLWYFFVASLLNIMNPLSYASNRTIWFNILVLAGASLFLLIVLFDLIPNRQVWINIRVIAECLMVLLLRDYDISIIFVISLTGQIVQILLQKVYILSFISIFILELIPMSFMISILYPMVLGYMDQFSGHLVDLLPILVIAFYSMYVCFSLLPISLTANERECIQRKENVKMGIQVACTFVFTIIFLAIFCKPKPYSLQFPLLVSQAEYIYENLSAVISSVPVAGEVGFLGLQTAYHKPNPSIQVVSVFHRIDIHGPAYVQYLKKVKLPRWQPEFPPFDLTETNINQSERTVRFTINGNVTGDDFNSVVLIIHCPNGLCVNKIDNNENLDYKVSEDGDDLCITRLSPVFTGFSADIQLNALNKVKIEVLFTTPKVTQERSFFKNSFRNYVLQYAKSYYIADTIFHTSRTI